MEWHGLDVLVRPGDPRQERRYCRPDVTEDRVLEIVDGRHPVLEQQLGSEFVANDVHFGHDDTLHLITGPNMAGKSTYIRQVALIAMLAQVGSYVPATSATIGLVDRLFTRIGASDELHSGQSTFMVEMTETANILNNATDRQPGDPGRDRPRHEHAGRPVAWPGRSPSTSPPSVRCRTLFATHYHELTDLAERTPACRI